MQSRHRLGNWKQITRPSYLHFCPSSTLLLRLHSLLCVLRNKTEDKQKLFVKWVGYLFPVALAIIITLFILSTQYVMAGELDDFSSDGCSQFPDGTFTRENLWCDCCITHDIAYWQGGSLKLKKQADEDLRACVLNKTNNVLLADTMYYGVTVGGLPIFPTWYRWGYGWRYGRGFKSLNIFEKQQVNQKLEYYFATNKPNTCDFEHPVKLMIKKELRVLKGQILFK